MMLSVGCVDRKHVEDASVPGEAGPQPDTPAATPIDGLAVGFEVAVDSVRAKLDVGAAVEVGIDIPVTPDVALDVTPDLLQGPEAMPDAPMDLRQPPTDLGPDNPSTPDGARDIPLDLPVLPDLATDLPWGPEVGPDLPPSGCVIGGTPYANGAPNPANPCQVCKLASPSSWSNADEGTACGSGQYCNLGTCKAGCYIAGLFYAASTGNEVNPCLICQPSSASTSWTQLPNGVECRAGQICNSGSCQAGCWIDGFVGSGATNASNICQICNPSKTTQGWSNNDAATAVPCGGCGGTAACTNMTLGPCSKDIITFYRDEDYDGYGTFSDAVQACEAPTGYVSVGGDCFDDTGSQDVYPGISRCQTWIDGVSRETCTTSGTTVITTCPTGCAGGECRSFATVGVAGQVTCGNLQCSTSEGCSFHNPGWGAGTAMCGEGASSYNVVMCDGPNDCPGGQICCYHTSSSDSQGNTTCVPNDGSCPSSEMGYNSIVVCDPNGSPCPSGTCQMLGVGYLFSIYTCR
jgi:hypothetical protein